MGQLFLRHLNHPTTPSDVYGTQIGTDFLPENLSFTLNKAENGPHEITYEISRSRDVIGPDFVGPYRTDFQLFYQGTGIGDSDTTIIAGPHTMLNLSSRAEHAKVGGKDWLHRLEDVHWPFDDLSPLSHRLGIPTTDAFHPPSGYAYKVTSRKVNLIIYDILTYVLALSNAPYFDIGFLPDIDPAIHYEISLIDTENMLSKIQSLSQQDPGGFDFWVDPDTRIINMVAVGQYDPDTAVVSSAATGIIHVFDSSVETSGIYDVDFTNTGPQFTRLMGLGQNSQSKDLVSVNEYTAASVTYGLKMGSMNFGDAKNRTRVQNLTRKNLLFGLNPVHEITLTVDPSQMSGVSGGAFWDTFKPGRAIWLKCNLEGHNIDSAQEIVNMNATQDNQGNVMVVFGLNQIYASATLDV